MTRDRVTLHHIKTAITMTDTTDRRGGVMTIDVVTYGQLGRYGVAPEHNS